MKKTQGFTLIEIMIALAVFAILSTITAATLMHAFSTRARVNAQSEQLNTIQVALMLIARDIEQIIQRPVIGEEMHLIPAFVGEQNTIEFTRAGIVNPNGVDERSTLKRIALICKTGKLIRRTWDTLDAPTRSFFHDKVLLSNLKACSFSYLNQSLQILPQWRNDVTTEHQQEENLPMAIQFNITIEGWGNMNLLFPISGAPYVAH